MFAGERMVLGAAFSKRGFGGVAGPIATLLVVAPENAFVAGRAERSGVGEIRLALIGGADLLSELVGMARGQIRCEGEARHGSAFVTTWCVQDERWSPIAL